ncbi:DUF885 domain-containing protein [Burkholderiaceae bacterium DAT-1]|nr:DUF885 domain-containing protein [Burkholderiaceae bacterium DAT-1]
MFRPVFPLSAIALSICLLSVSPDTTAKAAPRPAARPDAMAQTLKTQLANVAHDFYELQIRFDPMRATDYGENRYDDQLGKNNDPAEVRKQYQTLHILQRRLAAIKRHQLDDKDKLTWDVLEYELRSALALERFPAYLLPIDQMGSIPVTLASYGSGEDNQPLDTPKQYRAYLSRLRQLPHWIDQSMLNMRRGMRQHIVLPKALIRSTLPQYQSLLAKSENDNLYLKPIHRFPADFSSADKQALSKDFTRTVQQQVMPALRRLTTFMEQEYLPACRDTAGISSLPDGKEWYQARIFTQTGSNLKPSVIHEIGLKEVARIQSEFAKLAPKLGYDGPAAGLPKWVHEQPRYHPFTSEDQVIAEYKRIAANVYSKLPQLFNHLPGTPMDIRLEPEISRKTASDHYSGPSSDGTRPGVFWAVVNDPATYGQAGMTTLFLHEGVPGHHFHSATMLEIALPAFRKFSGNNAYTEGWALYAETLGKEMGLYDADPLAYEGHLTDELLRAARLVVDTGLHDKGWSREQAIQYFRETLGYDEARARNAIERYMAWPGQALGYKIGSLKIQELRQRAQDKLGSHFRLADFHDQILGEGTLPLSVLESRVDHWIETSGSNP